MTSVLERVRSRAGVTGIIVACLCLVSMALDMHAMRRNQIITASELRTGLFSRIDSFLWKADDSLKIQEAARKSLSAGLVQIRVQVEQASQDQQKALKVSAATTKAVVQESIQAASDAMEKAAGVQPHVTVESKPATANAPSVVVNPLLSAPTKSQKQDVIAAIEEKKKSWWRWLKFRWLVRCDARP